MIFEYDSCDIDWQSVCEHQQERELEWETAHYLEWASEQQADVEPWHDPAFIAMMEAQAESAEKELDMLLDIDF